MAAAKSTGGPSSRLKKIMKSSRVVWLGVKLREEPLKIWTRYKEKYGERNMVDL